MLPSTIPLGRARIVPSTAVGSFERDVILCFLASLAASPSFFFYAACALRLLSFLALPLSALGFLDCLDCLGGICTSVEDGSSSEVC